MDMGWCVVVVVAGVSWCWRLSGGIGDAQLSEKLPERWMKLPAPWPNAGRLGRPLPSLPACASSWPENGDGPAHFCGDSGGVPERLGSRKDGEPTPLARGLEAEDAAAVDGRRAALGLRTLSLGM